MVGKGKRIPKPYMHTARGDVCPLAKKRIKIEKLAKASFSYLIFAFQNNESIVYSMLFSFLRSGLFFTFLTWKGTPQSCELP